jgi:hypothetical protein
MNAVKMLALVALVAGACSAAPSASACDSCNDAVITQPAVLDSTMVAPLSTTVITQPAIIDQTAAPVIYSNTAIVERRRHHLFRMSTPFFGVRLF